MLDPLGNMEETTMTKFEGLAKFRNTTRPVDRPDSKNDQMRSALQQVRLGGEYFINEKWDETIEHLTLALRLIPDFENKIEVCYGLAVAYSHTREYTLAIEYGRKALKLDPNVPYMEDLIKENSEKMYIAA